MPSQFYQPPSVSTPLMTPPISTPAPQHPTSVLSPKQPPQNPDAASLLNLLREKPISQPSPLAALQNVSESTRSVSSSQVPPAQNAYGAYLNSPSSNPQSFLLNLLNQPKSTKSDAATHNAATHIVATQAPPPANSGPTFPAPYLAQAKAAASAAQRDSSAEHAPVKVFGSPEAKEPTPFEAPRPVKPSGMFTYVNPFETLATQSPPKQSTPLQHLSKKQRNATSDVPQDMDNSVIINKDISDDKTRSVAQALESVAGQVDRQVEQVLAQAETIAAPSNNKTAMTKKHGLDADDVAENWESVDVKETEEGAMIQVYTLPLRPFISITISANLPHPTKLREDSLMEIARLKKDFDQLDRTLVSASPTHIVYAMAKAGGYRIIRQDSGRDKQVFKSNLERVCNVQIASYDDAKVDNVLAVGINGTVFWSSHPSQSTDQFESDDFEQRTMALPPFQIPSEDNTSLGPVKTRASLSSRTRDMFAISRGKHIKIVPSSAVMASQCLDKASRKVDLDSYLVDRAMSVITDKACKDFAFSEDDSIVTTLDKGGRVQFWDIRQMRDAASKQSTIRIEQKHALYSLYATTSTDTDKLSPTSIMFVDRESAMTKGLALRYILVGFKQNHVLQLWDLALAKPVQEICLPRDSDTDAICTITYHPKTNVLAVGHPTRNSIFYIQFSAPKYDLPPLDQAAFLTHLATNDLSLPKPGSTAIFSGISEISFATKGQLRSIDMLRTPAVSNDSRGNKQTMFELYAMHAKGVTCIAVNRRDLGIDQKNKFVSPQSAEKQKLAVTAPLVPGGVPQKTPVAKVPEPKSISKSASKPSLKPKAEEPKPTQAVKQTPAEDAPAPSARPETVAQPAIASSTKPVSGSVKDTTPQLANGVKNIKLDSAENDAKGPAFETALSRGLEQLYRKIDEDRRVQDAAANARQDAVLRLVSSTLTDNVEKSLDKIVTDSINTRVLPTLVEAAGSVLDRRLAQGLDAHLKALVPEQIQASLPRAVTTALSHSGVARTLSESVAASLLPVVRQTLDTTLRSEVVPQLTQAALSSTQRVVAEVEAKFAAQLKHFAIQKAADDAKLDQMQAVVARLAATIKDMAAVQCDFQEQILKQRLEVAAQPVAIAVAPETAQAIGIQVEQRSSDDMDEELREIASLLFQDGNPSQAVLEVS